MVHLKPQIVPRLVHLSATLCYVHKLLSKSQTLEDKQLENNSHEKDTKFNTVVSYCYLMVECIRADFVFLSNNSIKKHRCHRGVRTQTRWGEKVPQPKAHTKY